MMLLSLLLPQTMVNFSENMVSMLTAYPCMKESCMYLCSLSSPSAPGWAARRRGYNWQMFLQPYCQSAVCPSPKVYQASHLVNSSSPAVGEYETGRTGTTEVLYEGNYKLMHYERGRELELYDLDEDPLEQNNLANIKIDSARNWT